MNEKAPFIVKHDKPLVQDNIYHFTNTCILISIILRNLVLSSYLSINVNRENVVCPICARHSVYQNSIVKKSYYNHTHSNYVLMQRLLFRFCYYAFLYDFAYNF